MKKIVISGPILARAGYGEMCRFAYRSLKSQPDLFDIYILPTNWGNTGNIFEDNHERKEIDALLQKTQTLMQQTNNQPNFDVAIQVTIPNEWKKMAAVNIGYTAGIETNMISPAWLQPSMQMDKIIVISEHAKSGFINSVFGDQQGNQYKVTTPVEVCHFPVRDFPETTLDLELKHDFNFLAVCQWSARKNLEQTIVNFIEEFKDENVGLVLKVNTANDSIIDREHTEERLKTLLDSFKGRKCSVNLLHGHMSEAEMQALYKHPKIKAIVSTTHGEGFGFPLFEAAYNELPIVATDWSGHLDFLTMKDEEGVEKKMFAKVEYELKPIAKEHAWQGVLEEGTSWAYPTASSFRGRMREVYKDYGRFKSWSKKLNKWVREEFNQEKVYNKFVSLMCYEHTNIDNQVVFTDIKIEEPIEVKKVSFCIPTNAKKTEKTKKAIQSIKNTMNKTSLDFEIILCGIIEPFTEIDGIKLVESVQDADAGMLAKLRNVAAENSNGDVIIFVDDDIIFEEGWATRLQEFSKTNHWDILGNKILLPDGGRYWDRAILNPHQMVNYDFHDTDKRLYQTGCFWIVRKDLFEKHKWDDTIEYYAQRNGKINEDVEYSNRLKQAGYKLKFDEKNTVWHWDENYQEVVINPLVSICLKKDMIPANSLKQTRFKPEFNKLVETLQ